MAKILNYINNESYSCYLNNDKGYEISLDECGYEKCKPSHYWRGRKKHFVLHYVLSGKGIFQINNGEVINVNKGQVFFISPYEDAYYKADDQEPWEYIWIGFSGLSAKSIMMKSTLLVNHVQNMKNKTKFMAIYKDIIISSRQGDVAYLLVLSALYKFVAYLLENYGIYSDNKAFGIREQNFRKILKMIDKKYMFPITIEHLSQLVGYEKSYVYRLFQQFLGMSPQRYINCLRIRMIIQRIKEDPGERIEKIVFETGFLDYTTFYRVFKQQVGCSPTDFKNDYLNGTCSSLQIRDFDIIMSEIDRYRL